jgi:hypothetical protein
MPFICMMCLEGETVERATHGVCPHCRDIFEDLMDEEISMEEAKRLAKERKLCRDNAPPPSR